MLHFKKWVKKVQQGFKGGRTGENMEGDEKFYIIKFTVNVFVLSSSSKSKNCTAQTHHKITVDATHVICLVLNNNQPSLLIPFLYFF